VRGHLVLERPAPPGQRWGCERALRTRLVCAASVGFVAVVGVGKQRIGEKWGCLLASGPPRRAGTDPEWVGVLLMGPACKAKKIFEKLYSFSNQLRNINKSQKNN
jgi:hypothetical protein